MKINKQLIQNINPYTCLSVLLSLTTVGYMLFNCIRLWNFTADDSFITFRYASNLAKGIGPTFNSTLPRAEGYTSYLWMIIMTIPHILNLGAVSFSKLIGILATLATMGLMFIFVVYSAKSENPYSKIAGGAAILFYAMLPETAVHAVSGMETAIYGFLLIGVILLAFLGIQGSKLALDWLPFAGLLNGLVRPEANLLVVVLLAITTIFVQNKRRFILRACLFYVLPGVLFFLLRWLYYGVFLPLPFYLKTGGVGLSGWPYVRDYLIFIFSNLILYLGFSLFGERRVLVLILAVAAVDLIFFLFVFPVMGYDFRFLFPLTPLLLVLAGIGLSLIFKFTAALVPASRPGWTAVAWVGLLMLVYWGWNNLPRTDPIFTHKLDYAAGLINNHISIGQTLSQINQKDPAPILVVTDAGAIPYYSGWTTIDAGGLNDPNIALGKLSAIDYIFGHDPDVLILTSNDLNTFRTDSAYIKGLYDTALTNEMILITRKPFYQGDSIWVMAKPGGEPAERLSEWANNTNN